MAMTKYAIPTIIIAAALVAGMFAFMPVEKATAVHTTIQGTQMTQSSSLFLDMMDQVIDCTSDAAFIVHYTIAELANGDDVTITHDTAGDNIAILLLFEIEAGGEGVDGVSGTVAGEAGEIILFDSSVEADGFIGLVTTSGATASCED